MTDVLIIARCLTVPVGFVDLSQDDQLILIKVGFFELWLCYVSRLATDLSLTFYDGTFITRQQLELIYDVRLNFSLKIYSVKTKIPCCRCKIKALIFSDVSNIIHFESR